MVTSRKGKRFLTDIMQRSGKRSAVWDVRKYNLRSLRILIGVMCSVIGTVPAYVFYSVTNPSSNDQSTLIIGMLVADLICLSMFIASRYMFKNIFAQAVSAMMGTYTLLTLAVIIRSVAQDELAETLMWLPIIMLFGFPAMFPLVVMTWIGTTIMFGKKKINSIKTLPGTSL